MNLSDAIEAGSKVVPQHFGSTFSQLKYLDGCACALGMAMIGVLGDFSTAKKYFHDNGGVSGSLEKLGFPQGRFLCFEGTKDTLLNTIIVMNDNNKMTPEEIVRYLRINGL